MKVIDLQEYKKEKDLKKATSETHFPLQIDSFYKNKELPLWIHVISHSIPSLFGGEQLVMAQAHDGKVLVFNFFRFCSTTYNFISAKLMTRTLSQSCLCTDSRTA